MTAKAILVLCAQALLAQIAFGQCLGRMSSPYGYDGAFTPAVAAAPCEGFGTAYDGIGAGFGGFDAGYGGIGAGYGAIAPLAGVAPASGGGLPIASASPILPSGLSVASENAIEGILAVAGDMPFVSAVALEGALPTAGAGSVAYGCGDGTIGIVSNSPTAPVMGLVEEISYSPGVVVPYSGLPARGYGNSGFGPTSSAFGRCRGNMY